MAKQLVLAVAGAGKTAKIINELSLERRFLIITYTQNNLLNIRARIIQKFGYLPNNIKVLTYFTFLYSFCCKPFLFKHLGLKGINFEPCRNRYAQGDARFIDATQRVYSNRLAKLLEVKGVLPRIVERLNKYFDVIMIDEIQDFAGHDFNLLSTITSANVDILFVGDFFQHTFDTSNDGNTNANLHSDYTSYLSKFRAMGLTLDLQGLSQSYRCSPVICEYISTNLGIIIQSHRQDQTLISFLQDEQSVLPILRDNSVIKLFYQNSKNFPCYSDNWGKSKGQDHFNDVCVVLNPSTLTAYQGDALLGLNPKTKNKLYVAITRTRGNLYLVAEALVKRALGL